MDHSQLAKYASEVSAMFERLYGITWQDASGEEELLMRSLSEGMPPEQFVREFGERYELTVIQSGWL